MTGHRHFARAHLYELSDPAIDTRFVSDNLSALVNSYNKLDRPSVSRSAVYYALNNGQGLQHGYSKYKHLEIRAGAADAMRTDQGHVVLVNARPV